MPSTIAREWLGGALVLLTTAACAGAAGDGAALSPKSVAEASLPAAERQLLEAGDVMTRPLDFERGGAHYVGGIATGVVPAPPERVLAAIDDTEALGAMLPHTKHISLVDAHGPTRRIELLQGSSVVEAKYTVELAPAGLPGEVRFHLDRSRHHDIDDVYGYFRVERFDDHRSLVTVAAAVDVGSGLTLFLFGKKVQDVILSTPHAMQDYFARADVSGAPRLVAENER